MSAPLPEMSLPEMSPEQVKTYQSLQEFAIARKTATLEGRRLVKRSDGVHLEKIGFWERFCAHWFGYGSASLKNVAQYCSDKGIASPELHSLSEPYNKTHGRIKQVTASLIVHPPSESPRKQTLLEAATKNQITILTQQYPTPGELSKIVVKITDQELQNLLATACKEKDTSLAKALILSLVAEKRASIFLKQPSDKEPNILCRNVDKKDLRDLMVSKSRESGEYEKILDSQPEAPNTLLTNLLVAIEDTGTGTTVVTKFMERYKGNNKGFVEFYYSFDFKEIPEKTIGYLTQEKAKIIETFYNQRNIDVNIIQNNFLIFPPEERFKILRHVPRLLQNKTIEQLELLLQGLTQAQCFEVLSQKDSSGDTFLHKHVESKDKVQFLFEKLGKDNVFKLLGVENNSLHTPVHKLFEAKRGAFSFEPIINKLSPEQVMQLLVIKDRDGFAPVHSIPWLLDPSAYISKLTEKLSADQLAQVFGCSNVRNPTVDKTNHALHILLAHRHVGPVLTLLEKIPANHTLLRQKDESGQTLIEMYNVYKLAQKDPDGKLLAKLRKINMA